MMNFSHAIFTVHIVIYPLKHPMLFAAVAGVGSGSSGGGGTPFKGSKR
jgi:hypothetical protein